MKDTYLDIHNYIHISNITLWPSIIILNMRIKVIIYAYIFTKYTTYRIYSDKHSVIHNINTFAHKSISTDIHTLTSICTSLLVFQHIFLHMNRKNWI